MVTVKRDTIELVDTCGSKLNFTTSAFSSMLGSVLYCRLFSLHIIYYVPRSNTILRQTGIS